MSWTLAEAKADLETVATRAREEGPQEITASDGTRFRLSMVQVEHGGPDLIDFLLASSWVGLTDEDAELINERRATPERSIDFE